MDQWGEGKAFQCKAADCGVELNLYIRLKIGFCSSSTGVVDDNELERLSDLDFMNGPGVALGEGHEINVAWMKGLLRAYAIASAAALIKFFTCVSCVTLASRTSGLWSFHAAQIRI
ncbi:MAG TPA: hypothetical protein VLN61_11140 [Pseudolabrys sp.]|nr:hypothetical protein [Pseudolabrys sp.]